MALSPGSNLGQLTFRRHFDDVERKVDASAIVVEPGNVNSVVNNVITIVVN
jgi:hypothetical protein